MRPNADMATICAPLAYEWRSRCKIKRSRSVRKHESGKPPTTTAKKIRIRFVRRTYEFGDDQCPSSGYRWFARRCTELSHHDMDHSEASGPARHIGEADCASGGALFRLHWRKLALAGRCHV